MNAPLQAEQTIVFIFLKIDIRLLTVKCQCIKIE
jgi:hypothetical protein